MIVFASLHQTDQNYSFRTVLMALSHRFKFLDNERARKRKRLSVLIIIARRLISKLIKCE